jgi:sugar/nucleoside kinase (ribokinase family)
VPPVVRRDHDARLPYVVALGALNVDLTAAPPTAAAATGVAAGPVEDGETPTTRRANEARLAGDGPAPLASLGGSAFNALVMLALLELDVRLGMVGVSARAAYGAPESHRERLARLGITDLTRHSSGRPGQCLAVAEGGRRHLYPAPEANLEIVEHLRDSHRLHAEMKDVDLLHVTSLLEDPAGGSGVAAAVAGFVAVTKAAHPHLVLSLDPGATWVDGLDRLPDLRRLYALADVVFVNPAELRRLDAHGVRASLPRSAVVVLKAESELRVLDRSGATLATEPRRDRTAAVDPTGAGDAVAAGVLAALATGRTLREGCALGLRLAAQRVSAAGDRGLVNLRQAAGEPWPVAPPRPVLVTARIV